MSAELLAFAVILLTPLLLAAPIWCLCRFALSPDHLPAPTLAASFLFAAPAAPTE